MRLRVLDVSFVLLLIGRVSCLGEQPNGPQTLENLARSDEGEGPSDAATEKPSTPRPAGTLARPSGGVRHPDLDKAWAEYDAAIGKTVEGIRDLISEEFDAATAKGDLESAEKWQTALEKFEKVGEVPTEAKMKAAVRAAAGDYKKAKGKLAATYESVVKALTIEKRLVEAKAARGELAAIKSSDQRDQKSPGVNLIVGRWLDHGSGHVWSFRHDGSLTIEKFENQPWANGTWRLQSDGVVVTTRQGDGGTDLFTVTRAGVMTRDSSKSSLERLK